MKNIPTHNTIENVKGKASNRVKELSESKAKKLKEALEHGFADLSTKDEMDMYISSYEAIHLEKTTSYL